MYRQVRSQQGCVDIIERITKPRESYEIAEALVHEHHARIIYPREHGNQRLLKSIKGLPRLHPA